MVGLVSAKSDEDPNKNKLARGRMDMKIILLPNLQERNEPRHEKTNILHM